MSMDEMPSHEFIARRKLNPYADPRAQFHGDELFWTKKQYRIFTEVLKSKHNLYVDAHWIDMNHMRKEEHRAYFCRGSRSCGAVWH